MINAKINSLISRTVQKLVVHTYITGKPVQFVGSRTFNKQGIPSVGMAPDIHVSNDDCLEFSLLCINRHHRSYEKSKFIFIILFVILNIYY